jgi:hypothetical protein
MDKLGLDCVFREFRRCCKYNSKYYLHIFFKTENSVLDDGAEIIFSGVKSLKNVYTEGDTIHFPLNGNIFFIPLSYITACTIAEEV